MEHKEELLGQSTPYKNKRLLIVYILLIVMVVIMAFIFTVQGVMDMLQIALTVATLLCGVGGLAKLLVIGKQPVYLYDSYFTVGNQRYSYATITKMENIRGQVQFQTGKGQANKHVFYAGNADALVYIINRKRKEIRRNKQKNA